MLCFRNMTHQPQAQKGQEHIVRHDIYIPSARSTKEHPVYVHGCVHVHAYIHVYMHTYLYMHMCARKTLENDNIQTKRIHLTSRNKYVQ